MTSLTISRSQQHLSYSRKYYLTYVSPLFSPFPMKIFKRRSKLISNGITVKPRCVPRGPAYFFHNVRLKIRFSQNSKTSSLPNETPIRIAHVVSKFVRRHPDEQRLGVSRPRRLDVDFGNLKSVNSGRVV